MSDSETIVFDGTMISDAKLGIDETYGLVVRSMRLTSADLGMSDAAWNLFVLCHLI